MKNTLTKKSSAWKLGFAGLATAALTLTGFTPAIAADVQLGPDDIAGFEIGGNGTEDGFNYDQWHVGSVSNTELTSEASLEFVDCSVTTLAVPADSNSSATVTQVLKGYSPTDRPSGSAAAGFEDVEALIDSISIDVAAGNVTLQVPFFAYASEDADPSFTTVRNKTTFGPGVHSFSDAEVLTGTGGVGDHEDFQSVFASFTNEPSKSFEVLGIGFTGSDGAVINSISFNGDTYYFGTGDCLPEVPVEETPTEEVPVEDPAVDPAVSGTPADPATNGNAVPVTAPKKPVIVDTGVLN